MTPYLLVQRGCPDSSRFSPDGIGAAYSVFRTTVSKENQGFGKRVRIGDQNEAMPSPGNKPHNFLAGICFLFIIPLCLSTAPLFAADVTLAWDAETGVAGYKLYYGTSSHAYDKTLDVGNVATYTVTGLGPATYYFAVTAYYTSGSETGFSNEVSTVITSSVSSDTTPPTTPTNLVAVALSATQIKLSWTASSDNIGVTGYKVYRNDVQIAESTSTYYQDSGLNSYAPYKYTVAAYDAAGNTSPKTPVVVVSTLLPAPPTLTVR